MDRSEINRALAKAIAYKGCGEDDKANQWAARLIELLDAAAILSPQGRQYACLVKPTPEEF